jgi:hypothetical protein
LQRGRSPEVSDSDSGAEVCVWLGLFSKMSMYGFEAMSFNVDGGYLEAIVRGYRSGLLTSADYNNLCQCENLDDIKMHLGATDYGPYLANGMYGVSSSLWLSVVLEDLFIEFGNALPTLIPFYE